ncbi:hypothetical protein FA95DRAFT_111729 [Auriscalpium vulgare]|uniref:Uncharacterized protein n=1 Tax=Auriscalpium vulgare TaxID=40419 RepID=A0ACB8S791_9AGAM|nr:hypothetical protein FA95DRAFT_111729 [Auriscalpium vulgare]
MKNAFSTSCTPSFLVQPVTISPVRVATAQRSPLIVTVNLIRTAQESSAVSQPALVRYDLFQLVWRTRSVRRCCLLQGQEKYGDALLFNVRRKGDSSTTGHGRGRWPGMLRSLITVQIGRKRLFSVTTPSPVATADRRRKHTLRPQSYCHFNYSELQRTLRPVRTCVSSQPPELPAGVFDTYEFTEVRVGKLLGDLG